MLPTQASGTDDFIEPVVGSEFTTTDGTQVKCLKHKIHYLLWETLLKNLAREINCIRLWTHADAEYGNAIKRTDGDFVKTRSPIRFHSDILCWLLRIWSAIKEECVHIESSRPNIWKWKYFLDFYSCNENTLKPQYGEIFNQFCLLHLTIIGKTCSLRQVIRL